MTAVPPPSRKIDAAAYRGAWTQGTREVPEETAIALSYGRTTHAVMMATPFDLEDFAIGFSLSEGIIAHVSEVEGLEIVPSDLGIELRMDVVGARMDALLKRRRRLTGATGCGLCGMESLAEAARKPAPLPPDDYCVAARLLGDIPEAMASRQALNRATHGTHAAGFWTEADGMVAVREDVGRHNALDKLAGALARAGRPAGRGVVALTSRVSVEMVQKAAIMGAPVIMAVSAPTALAVRSAELAGITLVGVARKDGFEVFSHPARIPGSEDGG